MKPEQVKLFATIVILLFLGFALGKKENTIRSIILNPKSIVLFSKDTISPQELKKILSNKNSASPILINVHTPYEGEIPKTDTFIPYDQIVADSASLPKDKNAAVILYCKSGHMSLLALETIKKLGFTNVRHLTGGMDNWKKSGGSLLNLSQLETEVTPEAGIELPISWNDIGPQLIRFGIIDLAKFKGAVKLTPEEETILSEGSNEKIRITKANSQFIVDVLWAIGLAQKSDVYINGPMGREYKKGAGNFASTGGWTLGQNTAMNYLNKFDLIKLTDEQQKNVTKIAQNIYRPCCGNSTWFPDCNHGMAALAAIEMMAAAGASDKTIYKNVLALNSYWFTDTYLTIATHFARQGISWSGIDAKMVLGQNYSSGQGAREIAQKVGPLPYREKQNGTSCGA